MLLSFELVFTIYGFVAQHSAYNAAWPGFLEHLGLIVGSLQKARLIPDCYLPAANFGREKRLRVSYFGTRGVEAVVRHFEQRCVVLAGFCLVACGFGCHAGVV